MNRKVLIATKPGDAHALAVAEALTRRGVAADLWFTPDFPHRAVETVRFSGGRSSVHINQREIDPSQPLSVWNRRVAHALDPDATHPDDAAFADRSCAELRHGLLDVMAPDAFWVNPQAAVRCNGKLRQLEIAARAGMKIPDTIVTNDPAEIRRFVREHRGQVVFKPLFAAFWKDGADVRAPYTTLVDEGTLGDDELLQAAPGIFQTAIAKRHELRVTVVGGHVLAARVMSQQTEDGQVDWRRCGGQLAIEPVELSPSVEADCLTVVRNLGLVFGCIDMIVTPGGDHVFLEVNQAGQFLFVESMAGIPLLDAMCELLTQGTPDFVWDPQRPSIRLTREIEESVEARMKLLATEHAAAPSPAWVENRSV